MADLVICNRQYKLGKTSGSASGCTLGTGAVLSPDASWVAWDNWNIEPTGPASS